MNNTELQSKNAKLNNKLKLYAPQSLFWITQRAMSTFLTQKVNHSNITIQGGPKK